MTFPIGMGFVVTLVLSIAAMSSPVAHAATEDFRELQARGTFAPRAKLSAAQFAQSIDHFGALPGKTFNQRYWVDTEFSGGNENAPVIFHVCGEGPGDMFLNDSAPDFARALGANLVYLEHRYYGASQPFADLSSDHLAYLTLNNAIEDLASFQTWIARQRNWRGKWVVIGGSYSATVAALYRARHPELVAGALAASAPMIAGQGSASNPNPGEYSSTSVKDSERAWTYEGCTSMGFWLAEGNSVFYPAQRFCASLFPRAAYVDFGKYNDGNFLPFVTDSATAPSNILFTYGSADVWTQLGIDPAKNRNPKIQILTIPGAGHHFDLNAGTARDSAAVKAARTQFLNLATQWTR